MATILKTPEPGAEPEQLLILNPELDIGAVVDSLARSQRARIPHFLSEGARSLLESLWQREDWVHLVSSADGALEFDHAAKRSMTRDEWRVIEQEAFLRARASFQYRYEALRVPLSEAGQDPLDRFARFMASGPMLEFLTRVLGLPLPLTFTDGQATAYGGGDFLTAHDDDVAGSKRVAAFVFGLTPVWRTEWGGLLLFHGGDEAPTTALVPQFNTLDLFWVPQTHSVSLVSPTAPHRRFAITGWISAPDR